MRERTVSASFSPEGNFGRADELCVIVCCRVEPRSSLGSGMLAL
jgi:hypothetical protein